MSILVNNTVYYKIIDIISMEEFYSNQSMWFKTLSFVNLHYYKISVLGQGKFDMLVNAFNSVLLSQYTSIISYPILYYLVLHGKKLRNYGIAI